jgi:UDP-2,3-diacylglucosamine pyrophosphatase LpxH
MFGIMSYQENIDQGLDLAFQSAQERSLDLQSSRVVIFSDHHKGAGDDADDFKQCAEIYRTALKHYTSNQFSLVILGDGEELWECRPDEVTSTYSDIFHLEKPFHEANRHLRIYGNHDDEWCYPEMVAIHLEPFFEGIIVYEAMKYRVHDSGENLGTLFFIHGHQGTTLGDRFGRLSRFAVRYLWRPFQRLTNIKSTTPATDWKLRSKHDSAMYNWAVKQRGVILVAGHTHKPNFPTYTQVDYFREIYTELSRIPEALPKEDLEKIQADLAFANAQEQPCYINSGCCSFSDGDISGIEIESGQIRLVRWSSKEGELPRTVLDSADLKTFFEEVAQPADALQEAIE